MRITLSIVAEYEFQLAAVPAAREEAASLLSPSNTEEEDEVMDPLEYQEEGVGG